jgi:hypothetical protein
MSGTITTVRALGLALAVASTSGATTLTERDQRFVASYREAVATAKRGQRAAAYQAVRRLVGELPSLTPALREKARPRLDRALVKLAPAFTKDLPEPPEVAEVPVLVVGHYPEPPPLPTDPDAVLVVGGPRLPLPEREGPPPEVLENFAREAESRGDLVAAFRHRLRRYLASPDDGAGCDLARVGDAYAAVAPGRRRRLEKWVRDLLYRESNVADCLKVLANAPSGVEPILQISDAHVPGEPPPQVFTYAQLVENVTDSDDHAEPFSMARPRLLSEVWDTRTRAAAVEVLELRQSSGPEAAFHRGVEVVRALRSHSVHRASIDLPKLVWPGDTDGVVGDLTSHLPPISYEHPRQGSAALKAWLLQDREGTIAKLHPGRRRRWVRPPPQRIQPKYGNRIRAQAQLVSLTSVVPGQIEEDDQPSLPPPLEERIRTAEYDDPQIMQELLQTVQFSSPIVLDLPGGDGELSVTGRGDRAAAVPFDIDGTGEPALVQWLLPGGDAWLAEDLDGDGRITSGLELFGTADGHVNGWWKLAERDLDGDGEISGEELAGLVLWQERRADGVSEPDELVPVADAGLTAITIPEEGLTSTARFGDEVRPAWDLFPTTWAATPALP